MKSFLMKTGEEPGQVYLKAVDGFRLTKVECTNADHTLEVSDDYSTPVILEPWENGLAGPNI